MYFLFTCIGSLGLFGICNLFAPILVKYSIYSGLYVYSKCMNVYKKGYKLIQTFIVPDNSKWVLFIKNNKITDSDSDFFISIQKRETILYKAINNIEINKMCNFHFINCSVNIQNENYIIRLQNNDETYFIEGNVIDKFIIYYLLRQQHDKNYYNFNYILSIIDQNVKMITLDQSQSILLKQSDYQIV